MDKARIQPKGERDFAESKRPDRARRCEARASILADGIEVWCSYDKLVKVEGLIPNPKNPNTHPQNQIKILAQNIRYHGWRHPITVSKLSGYVVAGHGRLEAAKELGVSIVPVEYSRSTARVERNTLE